MEERRTQKTQTNNPNKHRNRVPMGAELATLRSIRMQKQQLANTVAGQVKIANEAHSRIQARLRDLLREVEAAQSELAASENYISMLETQQATLLAEDDELAGLLHPIRRCPMATNISHVCQFWRAIALETSVLWGHISVSVEDKPEDVAQLIKRTIPRTPSGLKEVGIYQIGSQPVETIKSILQNLRLDDFKVIDKVFLFLVETDDITHVNPVIFGTALLSTRFVGIQADTVFEEGSGWDFSWLLRQPQMEAVYLKGLDTVFLEGDDSFPRLRGLDLDTVCMPTLASHLPRLFGLVELKIHPKFAMGLLLQDFSMPNLLALTTREVMDFPWNRITAPQLRSLNTDDDEEDIISFLSRHPSVRDLDYYRFMTAEGFKNLAIDAPQLNVLDIAGYICGIFRPIDPELSFPPFPKLTKLLISEGDDYKMCSQDLEDFVKMRCSPPRDHKVVSLISELIINGDFDGLSHAPWRSSSFLDTCTQTLERSTKDNTKGAVSLRWSHA